MDMIDLKYQYTTFHNKTRNWHDGVDGLLIDIIICFVSDLDFGSLLILLEFSMVTHVVSSPTNCWGYGTTP